MKRRVFFAALFGAPVASAQFTMPPITINTGPRMNVNATRMSPTVWGFDFAPKQLAVYRNGIRQSEKLEYVIIGSSVLVPDAQPDDVLVFDAT